MSRVINRLEKPTAAEVSTVRRGAQKQRFLLTKTGQEDNMKIEALLKTILESKVDNEAELVAMMEKAELTEDEMTQVKIALRALDGIRDKVPDDVMSKLMELVGAEPQELDAGGEGGKPPEGGGEMGKGSDGGGAAIKSGDAVVVRKDDGTLDFSGVPEGSRALVKQLWESKEASDARVEKLSKSHEELLDSIRAGQFEKKAAKEFAHIPGGTKEIAGILKELDDKDSKLGERVQKLLGGAEAALKQEKLFGEVGAGGAPQHSEAWEEVQALAEEYRKTEKDLTKSKAIALVMKRQPDLYRRYKAERSAGRGGRA